MASTPTWRLVYLGQVSRCTADVAQYQIRFFKMMIKLMAVYVLVTWPILLPINAIQIAGGNKDGLAQLAFGKYVTYMYSRPSRVIFIACRLSGSAYWLTILV